MLYLFITVYEVSFIPIVIIITITIIIITFYNIYFLIPLKPYT